MAQEYTPTIHELHPNQYNGDTVHIEKGHTDNTTYIIDTKTEAIIRDYTPDEWETAKQNYTPA